MILIVCSCFYPAAFDLFFFYFYPSAFDLFFTIVLGIANNGHDFSFIFHEEGNH